MIAAGFVLQVWILRNMCDVRPSPIPEARLVCSIALHGDCIPRVGVKFAVAKPSVALSWVGRGFNSHADFIVLTRAQASE